MSELFTNTNYKRAPFENFSGNVPNRELPTTYLSLSADLVLRALDRCYLHA